MEGLQMTHLKPIKECKTLKFNFHHLEAIDSMITRIDEFKASLIQFKEEGWEGNEWDGSLGRLYKFHWVEDEEYDRAITLALQNKPSWDEAPEEAESLAIAIWDCDYQYQWVWFYHQDPLNTVFAENRPTPKVND